MEYAQIRYQGVLHSIDPQAATISLEKGQSVLSLSHPYRSRLSAVSCPERCQARRLD